MKFLPFSARQVAKTASSPVVPARVSEPQIPLFLKPAIHYTRTSDLKSWYTWAIKLASSCTACSHDANNDLDGNLLKRELNWLLQDSLDTTIEHAFDTENVRLKTKLEDLRCLWNQRVYQRRPFQYIVGCEHWRNLVLSVQEGVLIPRPETEKLVDLVDDAIKKNEGLKHGVWIDLGTGSGAIAIGIGRILSGFGKVIATDLSSIAISVASFNVKRYDLQDVVELRRGYWLDPVRHEKKLAGIVSNPPYIPTNQIARLQAEVSWYEPKLALDGGIFGMDHLLHLCNGVAELLAPGGFFALETNGAQQCEFLMNYMEDNLGSSFHTLGTSEDFFGVRRFIYGVHS